MRNVSTARLEALLESYRDAIRHFEKTRGKNCIEIEMVKQKMEIARMEYRLRKQKYELHKRAKEEGWCR